MPQEDYFDLEDKANKKLEVKIVVKFDDHELNFRSVTLTFGSHEDISTMPKLAKERIEKLGVEAAEMLQKMYGRPVSFSGE